MTTETQTTETCEYCDTPITAEQAEAAGGVCSSCHAECYDPCGQCHTYTWKEELIEGLCEECQSGWDRLLQKAVDEIQMAGTARRALKVLADAGLID